MLTGQRQIAYWQSREDVLRHGRPEGLVIGESEELYVLFRHGAVKVFHHGPPAVEIRQISRGKPYQEESWDWGHLSLCYVRPGKLAVLYAEPSTEAQRFLLLFSTDFRLLKSINLGWHGWVPAGLDFAVTPDGHFVLPHDRTKEELRKLSCSGQPLLDRYDTEGRLVGSFGISQPHDDLIEDKIFQRAVLSCHTNGDCFVVLQCPYRLLRFDPAGRLLWDRNVEASFQPRPIEIVTRMVTPADVEQYIQLLGPMARELFGAPKEDSTRKITKDPGKLVKDIAVGTEYLAVLVAEDQSELHSRSGRRIDLFTLDNSNRYRSFVLDYPAAFIHFSAQGHLWALHEPTSQSTEQVAEHPYLIEYAIEH